MDRPVRKPKVLMKHRQRPLCNCAPKGVVGAPYLVYLTSTGHFKMADTTSLNTTGLLTDSRSGHQQPVSSYSDPRHLILLGSHQRDSQLACCSISPPCYHHRLSSIISAKLTPYQRGIQQIGCWVTLRCKRQGCLQIVLRRNWDFFIVYKNLPVKLTNCCLWSEILAVCLSGWLAGWLAVWLAACLTGWLAGCLAG